MVVVVLIVLLGSLVTADKGGLRVFEGRVAARLSTKSLRRGRAKRRFRTSVVEGGDKRLLS